MPPELTALSRLASLSPADARGPFSCRSHRKALAYTNPHSLGSRQPQAFPVRPLTAGRGPSCREQTVSPTTAAALPNLNPHTTTFDSTLGIEASRQRSCSCDRLRISCSGGKKIELLPLHPLLSVMPNHHQDFKRESLATVSLTTLVLARKCLRFKGVPSGSMQPNKR